MSAASPRSLSEVSSPTGERCESRCALESPGDTVRRSTIPELLAPAGNRQCIQAAIENGADAVYFGLEVGFNARARAENLTLTDLPDVMATLHERGVRGYVTLNTLVFSDELTRFAEHVEQLARAGVDAVLVQDLGAARLVREICPDMELHASTQMTMTSAETIDAITSLGISRVVLARELSLDEIREIRQQTEIPLEVFVHGALCVAYSGQCLTSESLGGRSANRGQCAQACRLPYELVCDGRDVDLGAQQYLLSPQDLAAYELIPTLVELGVASFKIEGRLKTPEYVANMTQQYRRAIDLAVSGQAVVWQPEDRQRAELSFSRGFSPGWLNGCDHKMLVPGLTSAKRGVLAGTIVELTRGRIQVTLTTAIQRGDGVVFAGDRTAGEEQGGRVYGLQQQRRDVERATAGATVDLFFQPGKIDSERLYVGQQLWKTDDPQLMRELRSTFTAPYPVRTTPVDLTIAARVGAPLQVTARIGSELAVTLTTEESLEAARKHPLTPETLREQFGRLGQTPFHLGELTVDIQGAPMAPLSVLGKLRHRLVAALAEARQARPARTIQREGAYKRLREKSRAVLAQDSAVLAQDSSTPAQPTAPALHVLCRWPQQVPIACQLRPQSLYAEFADIREYRSTVEQAREQGVPLWIAPPRIFKPGERGVLRLIEKAQPAGILVRNLATLRYFRPLGIPLIADFSLNAANELTLDWLREQGVERVTASYDLNREQLLELVRHVDAERLEVVIHQHMPMFHMEHCVFCAVLSPGTNKTNCGRPCDEHRVQLRDRVGMLHPLHADVGCRNTLYNQVPQSAAEVVPQLVQQQVAHYRVELLDQTDAVEIERTVQTYRELLAGQRTGREVWQQLHAMNRVGVTRGSLEERRNPLAII